MVALAKSIRMFALTLTPMNNTGAIITLMVMQETKRGSFTSSLEDLILSKSNSIETLSIFCRRIRGQSLSKISISVLKGLLTSIRDNLSETDL